MLPPTLYPERGFQLVHTLGPQFPRDVPLTVLRTSEMPIRPQRTAGKMSGVNTARPRVRLRTGLPVCRLDPVSYSGEHCLHKCSRSVSLFVSVLKILMFTWTRLAASDFGENWAINLTLTDFAIYDLVYSGKQADMDAVRIVVTLTEVTGREQGGVLG